MPTRSIAIVGCGFAGAAAALFLARDGHRVTVFEAVADPGPVGAGLLIQPTGALVLAEVRYRSHAGFGGALGSVGPRKQRRLIAAARHLLMQRPQLARRPARFDVVAVGPGDGEIDWVRDAFQLPG